MSGYGGADDESVNAMAMVDNFVDIARSMIPQGSGTLVCVDCGDPIPAARKVAIPGCRFCVECQVDHDKRPGLNIVTRML